LLKNGTLEDQTKKPVSSTRKKKNGTVIEDVHSKDLHVLGDTPLDHGTPTGDQITALLKNGTLAQDHTKKPTSSSARNKNGTVTEDQTKKPVSTSRKKK
jgi:hypothetical protein